MADSHPRAQRAGIVYVIFNEREPYLVKVGRTTKRAEERARELRTTGVPGRFIVAYDVYVNDAPTVESAVHSALVESRYVKDREFFTCGPKAAIDALLRAARGRTLVSPWADSEVELLPQIAARFSTVLKSTVTSIAMTVQDDAVVLRCAFRNWDNEITTIETNLASSGVTRSHCSRQNSRRGRTRTSSLLSTRSASRTARNSSRTTSMMTRSSPGMTS